VLPSSKRPGRGYEPSEVIRTGDYEVVHSTPSSKRRAAAQPRITERPRVFQNSVDDEEKTTLFTGAVRTMLPPRGQAHASNPPIAKAARVPNMNLRGLTRGSERPPSPESLRGSVRPRIDAEDRTILRPTSTLPPALQRTVAAAAVAPVAAAPKPRPPSARPPAMMPTPYMPFKPPAAAQTAPPVSMNAPGGSDMRRPAPSDPHGDPPSAVITAKTRILRTKSSMSWAVGLMALGTMVGLVTAVVARGDADALIDATASFVDPSHATAAHANGAVAQAAVLPSFVVTASKAVPFGTDTNPAPGSCLDTTPASTLTVTAPVVLNAPPPPPLAKTALLAGADPAPASRPIPPKPAPVAVAAPRYTPRPVAAAPVPKEDRPSSGWLANVTPPNAGGPIARPSRASAKAASNDFESAAAADALAKAQLEASLR
jgi:hypothetical protein